jgi:hypothetical protein
MTRQLLAGLALAFALVFTSAVAVAPQYWNPDKTTSMTAVDATA